MGQIINPIQNRLCPEVLVSLEEEAPKVANTKAKLDSGINSPWTND